MDTGRLEKLGLTTAANKVNELREQKRKMTIAYEHYRYVKQEKIDEFNSKLRDKSMKETKSYYQFDQLVHIPLAQYSEVPPTSVLDKVEEAINMKCFDSFEVSKIQSVQELKDPIVFGRINGCPDRFFVAQWDDDVKIDDILEEYEG